jgi:hypothetical protein
MKKVSRYSTVMKKALLKTSVDKLTQQQHYVTEP